MGQETVVGEIEMDQVIPAQRTLSEWIRVATQTYAALGRAIKEGEEADKLNRQKRRIVEFTDNAGIVPLAELEKREILRAVKVLNGNVDEAAKRLGLGRTSVYRKLKEYAEQGK
jgi:transcriptional regulator of acetoin/glycerol metabolism